MHRLRTSKTLARLILACFALALLAAIVSPMVNPQSVQLVCSDGAMTKIVVVDDNGEVKDAGHGTPECPLCLAATFGPPFVPARFELPSPLAHALQPIVAARLAGVAGPALPARGPPALA